MKKGVLVFLLVFLCSLSFVVAEQSVIADDNLFRVTLLGHDPSPIQPGVATEFSFEITYLGSESYNPLEVSFVQEFPFKIASNEELTKNLGMIQSGETKAFSFMAVPSLSTESGTYDIGVQYFSPARRSVNVVTFTVDVSTILTDLSGASISTSSKIIESEGIPPGGSSEVIVRIDNLGAYMMRDVSVKFDLSSDDTPFAPIGGTSERKISAIPIGGTKEASIDVVALPSADGGIYKVPLTISYYDAFGTLIEKSDLVSLIVNAPSELSLLVDDTSLYARGPGTVSLRLVNKGLTDVKFLTVRLLESDGYEILRNSQEYIGDLDSDDYELAEFLIKAKKSSFDLKAKAEFRDAQNVLQEEEFTVPFSIVSKKALGEANGNSFLTFLLFVIVVIFVIVDYRRWRRRHENIVWEEYFVFVWHRVKNSLRRVFRRKSSRRRK